MPTRLRFRFVLPVVALAAGVAFHPTLARAAGVDFWNLDAARAALAAEAQQAAVLADRDEAILRRIVIKEDLIDDLVAGRLGLADVSARFLELNADEPMYLELLRTSVRGDSDAERAARNVIDYAAARPDTSPDLLRRLEADLARMQDAPAAR